VKSNSFYIILKPELVGGWSVRWSEYRDRKEL